jgi:YHS domain-containing protein
VTATGGMQSFLFADLAGFTALTEAHGDDEAIRIVLEFIGRVRRMLPDYGAEEVKTIGDELMIRTDDPNEAVRLGMRIVDELAFHGSPPVRVGVHTGSATRRDGDWFGSTVNIASRVVDAARPGEVLITEATRQELDGRDGLELYDGGQRHFKNLVQPVSVFGAVARGAAKGRLEIDPVCRMAVDPVRAASAKRRRGISYFFCSDECRRAFDADPLRHIITTHAGRLARSGFLINLAAFLILGGVHLIAWAVQGFSGGSPGMLALYAAWAIALLFHYRTVRTVI